MDRRMFLAGAAAMAGDGLIPPLNAPPGHDLSYGVQPGSTGVITARRVIVFGPNDGVFVYNGTPALGNPPIFWATDATADPYGNALTSTAGLQGSGTFVVGNLKLTAAGISAAIGNPLDVNGLNIGLSSPNSRIELNGSAPLLFDGATLFDQPIGTVKPGTTDTLETWHAMTPLLNSWANAAGNVACQYKMVAGGNNVEVIGTPSAAAATTATLFTLPAGYRPTSQQVIGGWATGGQVAGSTPFWQVDTGGNITLQHGTIGAADSYPFHGVISLDA